nr:hypothetical protein [uncultured Pseudoxanthomonas sp.]
MATKQTGPKAAKAASKVLSSTSTGKASKAAAGSALTQSKSKKENTSARVASAASKVLRDGRTSASSKSAAGSALSQARKKAGGGDTGPLKPGKKSK